MSQSYSDDDLDIAEPVEYEAPSVAVSATKASSKSSNAGMIAGAVIAGVGIAAAVGARIIFKKKPTKSSSRPLSARGESRRTVPTRRARSTASGASSVRVR